jgi:hypothetical protein
MEGVTDETLAALAEDIARDDAAAAAASPRRSKGGASAAVADAAGDDQGGDEDEVDDELPSGGRHARGRSSSSMLNLLLDLDLGAALSPVDGAEDEEADEWVSVSAPMAGGTHGVFASGAVPPAAAQGAAGASMARPSLRMLAAEQQQAQEADLICLNSPQKPGRADGAA